MSVKKGKLFSGNIGTLSCGLLSCFRSRKEGRKEGRDPDKQCLEPGRRRDDEVKADQLQENKCTSEVEPVRTTNMEGNIALINLSGGGPYGFRLMEGPTDLLVVDKVREDGKAQASGLKEGDRLLEVNGKDCRRLGVEQINQLMEAAGQNLVLKVDRSRGNVGVGADLGSGMTITAPQGVHVQRNQDQSITMTIGMPFDLDSALAGAQQKTMNEYANKQVKTVTKIGSTQKTSQSPTPTTQKAPQPAPAPSSPDGASGKKKIYMDSMFYDDHTHKYPTVDEQITLARRVALDFHCPENVNSKGYKMFVKMLKRAAKYTTGATEEELAAAYAEDPGDPVFPETHRPRPAGNGDVGGLPASIVFAPKLPNTVDKERMDAMSMEEIERMELSRTKLTHKNVNPQLCFNLADDLKNMKGKGGRLFAQRQAKAESWCVGDSDDAPADMHPSGEVMQKFTSQWRPDDQPETPQNRLKDLTDVSKSKMTPWDSAAEYGTVDKAFEHLDDSKSKGKISKTLTDNLEASLASLKRDQAGRSAAEAQKKSVSVDPERLKALGHHPKDIGRAYGSKGANFSSESEKSSQSTTSDQHKSTPHSEHHKSPNSGSLPAS